MNRVRNLRPSFGLDIWQIFMGIAAVLSIASVMMWFGGLQPYTALQDFIWVDEAKSKLYTTVTALELKHIELQEMPYVSGSIRNQCYTDIAGLEISTNPFELISNELLDTQQVIEGVSLDYRSSANTHGKLEELQDLINHTQGYHDAVQKYHKERLQFFKQTLEIQKQASQVCIASESTVEQESQILQDVIRDSRDSLPNNEIWLSNAKDWSALIPSIFETARTTPRSSSEFQGEIRDLREKFIAIYDISFDPSISQEYVDDTRNLVNASTTSLEQWQKSTASRSKPLQGQYVTLMIE